MQKAVFYSSLYKANTYFPQRPYDGEITMFILFVKHRQNISIMHKIYQHDFEDHDRLNKML